MYSFIILHYKNIEETTHCLDLINTYILGDKHVIVVDNNTLNDTDKKEIEKYTKDIIVLDENLGFAKANNIGIKYAKDKYNSKYYIVMNNDVFITQNNFLEIIDNDYKEYNFDMLGPSIDSPTGESVNPFPVFKTREEIEKEIVKCNKLIKIYNSKILYFLLETYLKLKHLIKKPIVPKNSINIEKNIALHGCCIIFSDKYINKYEYPFYNETFLFHEEEFLYQRMLKDNLISLYDPNLKIYHKEGSSINKKNKNKRLSKLFRVKERIKSLELLLKEI